MEIRNNPTEDRPLTLKQRRFAVLLPTARSQTEAAEKAGYALGSAHQRASENVRKRNVAAAIAREEARIAEYQRITEDEVAAGLRREAGAGNKREPNGVRVSALMGLAKLGGLIDKEKGNEPSPNQIGVQINVLIADPSARRALEALGERLEGLTGGHGGQVVERSLG